MAKTKTEKAITLRLFFSERMFKIGQLFPEETNVMNAIILKDLRNKLALSQGELKTFDVKVLDKDKGKFSWTSEKDKSKSISFTNAEMQRI